MAHRIVLRSVIAALIATVVVASHAAAQDANNYQPGKRVLLDAHNCYPYEGRWADRIDRALATGVPLAIEEDLVWYEDPATGAHRSIVSHGQPFTGKEPTLDEYFFERVRPIVEKALANGDKSQWPLITLNLDLKDNDIEHCEALWLLLENYKDWLTTARRTDDITKVMPLDVKPILVLTAGGPNQFQVFYEAVATGDPLLLFGAALQDPMQLDSLSRLEQIEYHATVTPDRIVSLPADNFRRWWNNSWYVVEPGGAPRAAEWTAYDAQRLKALTDHAHALGYWIRFYTLNGYQDDPDMGWSRGYNFGSKMAVEQRWGACIEDGVDFVATDMYEDFAAFKAKHSN